MLFNVDFHSYVIFFRFLPTLVIAGKWVLLLGVTDVGLSICPLHKMVRFISNKDQNVPGWSVYRPTACWRVNGQISNRGHVNAEIVFSPYAVGRIWSDLLLV